MQIKPTIMVRELFNGDVLAFPLADPTLISYAEEREDVLLEMEMFLKEHLTDIPAQQLSRFVYPEGTELVEVEVMIPRPDLPKALQPAMPIALSCLVIPQRHESWVYIVALQHTFYLEKGESLPNAVEREVTRQVSAREMGATEYLALLPARMEDLVSLPLELDRLERLDPKKMRNRRENLAKKKRHHEAKLLLEEVGVDLLKSMKRTKELTLVGQEKPLENLAALLTADEAMSVVVVGPPLSGKTALIRELVRSGKLRRSLILTSGARLIAGQSGFGQWQDRLHRVMKAAEEVGAILYFDDLNDLFAGQSGGSLDMAGAMRPYIEDGRVRVVGEVSLEALESLERRHVGFFGALHKVRLEEVDAAQALEVLRARVRHGKKLDARKPALEAPAMEPLIELSDRYLPYQSFPGKAMQILDDLVAMYDSNYLPEEGITITAEDVYKLFCVRTGIPEFLLREDNPLKRHAIVDFFGERIIGQREAIARVADVVCAVKARLQPPGKPLATFLFIGPTGVGKTEVAKTLSRFLFGSPDRLVRFDMSEYMDASAAARLIQGSSSGEGELTRRVRQQPFCALLLDEIEKAHPAVFDLLLQVCGEGRLTDARGRTTHFHNAIIIMTSNLGVAHRRDALGFGEASAGHANQQHMDEVRRHFRPEFVNRLDAVVGFEALTRDQALAVCRVTLKRICARAGMAEHRVSMHVSERAALDLANAGHSDAYGARALRRHLDDVLVSPMAKIFAAHASQLAGAQVFVEHIDEEPYSSFEEEITRPGTGTLLGTVNSGNTRISVHRGERSSVSRELRGFDAISGVRRRAANTMKVQRILELRSHLDFLLAQFNYGNRGSRKGKQEARAIAENARLHSEYFELDNIWKTLARPVTDIEDAEELAITALFEGETLQPYIEEAERAYEEFSVAFVYAMLARVSARDETFLSIRRINGPGSVWMEYLEGFLDMAQERGWDLLFHLDGDRKAPDSGQSWAGTTRWGPPRSLERFGELLTSRPDDYHGMLVRVRGDFAGALLALEIGRHVFSMGGDQGDHELYVQHICSSYAPNEERMKRYLEQPIVESDKVQKMRPVRRWTYPPRNRVDFPNDGNCYLNITTQDYWRRYDKVAAMLLMRRFGRRG